jgi:hypothetical protein
MTTTPAEIAAKGESHMGDLLRGVSDGLAEIVNLLKGKAPEAAEAAESEAEEDAENEEAKDDDKPAEAEGDGKGAGYDDLEKAIINLDPEGNAYIDATKLVTDMAKSQADTAATLAEVKALLSSMSAELVGTREDLAKAQVEIAALTASGEATRLALACMTEKVLSPMAKAVIDRDAGQPAGVAANPAGAEARMGVSAGVAAAPAFTTEQLEKAVSEGRITVDQHVAYATIGVFSRNKAEHIAALASLSTPKA